MPRLELVRHAMTGGNLAGRYTGVTDEGLCPEGEALARRCARPSGAVPRRVWVSPLRRCRETAAILYPGAELVPVPALRETAFGPFENRTHRELEGDPLYREWVRSAGTIPVPGLEGREEVAARAIPAFLAVCKELMEAGEDGAVVTHGGVIMEVCSALGEPRRDYYRWQVPCCGGWRAVLREGGPAGRFTVSGGIRPPGEGTR